MKVRFEDDQTFRIARLTEKEVASTWKKLATKDYNNLIRDCLLLRVEHQLSDWAYLHMLHNMGEACVGSGNEGVLLAGVDVLFTLLDFFLERAPRIVVSLVIVEVHYLTLRVIW